MPFQAKASERYSFAKTLCVLPGLRQSHPTTRIAVWQVLSRLPPRQRAVLHLTAVEGMTDAEIGVVLGIAPASVRVHRRRARMKVEKLLGRNRR